MGHNRENTPKSFTRLASWFGRKQPPPIDPFPKSPASPAPQTSLIFELPDELILSILSYTSPEPQLTGYHARFRGQYCMQINDDHHRRAQFLRPLSMTCRAMRLRLQPWIWDLIEPSRRRRGYHGFSVHFLANLITLVNSVHADTSLAMSVKYLCALLCPWVGLILVLQRFMTVPNLRYDTVPAFVECLLSFPNLHTLEIRSGGSTCPSGWQFMAGIKRTKLPQIKTLILPPAHPLLKHCPNAEDIDWVVRDRTMTSDEFLGSLASIGDSKIKRLAIPLILPGSPSRFVAACPMLTELTVLYPHPHPHWHPSQYPSLQPASPAAISEGLPPCAVESARSAISELVNACKALQDFGTLQIVHLALAAPPPRCWCGEAGCGRLGAYTEERKLALRRQMKDVKDWTIGCLKKPETEPQGGEGRKRVTLRVIELSSVCIDLKYGNTGLPRFDLGSVKVEEYEV